MLPFRPIRLLTVDELISMIGEEEGIQGVTILGGEPLDQSDGLVLLARLIKNNGLDLMLYTGYELNAIPDEASRTLLNLSDIVVSGPYIESERDTSLRWRGSRNQTITFIEGHRNALAQIEERNEVEIHLSDNGEMVLLGYPDEELRRIFYGS